MQGYVYDMLHNLYTDIWDKKTMGPICLLYWRKIFKNNLHLEGVLMEYFLQGPALHKA